MFGQAERSLHVQFDGVAVSLDRIVSAHPFLQAVALCLGLGAAALHQEDELIPAPASDDVRRAARRLEFGGKLLQQFIANQVAVIVVDLLEPVDVQDGYAQRASGVK